jgi:predicted branched-subunit amino acid permease
MQQQARSWAGFRKAIREAPLAPALILFTSFMGFGALVHSTGFGLAPGLYTTVFVFALPAQVVLVDQVSRGLPLLSVALAVTLTAIRFLPLTITIMPLLRGGRRLSLIHYLAAHFVAITIWIESMRRIPVLPGPMRLSYFFGLAATLVGVAFLGTIAGFAAAGFLPDSFAAALLLLNPLYFFLGLMGGVRRLLDYAPLLLGFALGPLFYKLTPSFDLALTGLVGGTAAFLLLHRDWSGAKGAAVPEVLER